MDQDPATTATGEDNVGRKRKRSPASKEESEEDSYTGRSATEARDDSATPETISGSDPETSCKRPRIDDVSDSTRPEDIPGLPQKEEPKARTLPLEVWQQICSLLEPVSLGRLICVNRTLNALLDPEKPVPEHMAKQSITQNDIWVASRKRLPPGFPRPLSGRSELEMWRLLLGTRCQFCGKESSKMLHATPSPWTSGPGLENVRVIWPFAVRSCGHCLTSRMIKDTELWFSDVSILLPVLPSAYFTPELNLVASIALRASSPPPGLKLTRYFFRAQLDHLREKIHHNSDLGPAASEEWIKGLDTSARQKMEDAKRFEHWEATGGFQALLRSKIKHGLPAKPILAPLSLPSVPSHVQASKSAGSRAQSPRNAQYRPSPPAPSIASGFNTPHLPLKPASPAPGQSTPGFSQHNTPQGTHGRPERSIGEVNKRKAIRRAEIEHRCLQLDPPIQQSTLPFMAAFNNAMLIPMPLNENAWQALKPRLVAQHEAALKKEEKFSAANRHLQTQAEERPEQEEQLQQARTQLERQFDEAQRPVREKLAAYADELIASNWDDGSFVTKDNAPQFAADLLIYVRRKFFEPINKSDRVPETQGANVPSPLPGSNPDRHLTLEDMKWVYETKIKPITQLYSREIFLCGACDVDRRHYALDAVIQHYAAKHTHDFSHGSAVVYWKANWPLEPPFDTKPISSPRNRQADQNGVSPMYQRDSTRPQQFDPGFPIPQQIYPTRPALGMTPDMAPRSLQRYAPSAYSVVEELHQPRSYLVPVQTSNPASRRGIHGVDAAREQIPYEMYYGSRTPASPAFSSQGLAATPYRGYAAEVNRQPYSSQRHETSMMTTAATNGYGYPPPLMGLRSELEPRVLAQPSDRTPQTLGASGWKPPIEALLRHHSPPHSPVIVHEDVHDFLPFDLPINGTQDMPATPDQGQQEQRPGVAEIVRENEYDPHRPAPPHAAPMHEYEFEQPRPSYHTHIEDRFAYTGPVPHSIAAPKSFMDIYPGISSSRARLYEDPMHARPYKDDRDEKSLSHSLAAPRQADRSGRENRTSPRPLVITHKREQTQSPIQQVKLEAARSPPRTSATGTTQFLKNFDVDEGPRGRCDTPDQTSLPDRISNNASSNRSGLATVNTPYSRDRLTALERDDASARSRSTSAGPLDGPRFHGEEHRFRRPAHPLENEPVQQIQYPNPRYFGRPIYQTELVPEYYEPVRRYRTRSPQRGQQEIAIRYVDPRPAPGYMYSDDIPYQQDSEDLVQLMPHGVPRAVQRQVVYEPYPQYVNNGAGYDHAIDDRAGPVYEDVPPQRQNVRYDTHFDERRSYR